jgi:hypothetical protein
MSKYSESSEASSSTPEVEVLLDGLPVQLPKTRRSLAAIRSYLETLAMEQQRFLFAMTIDGKSIDLSKPQPPFTNVGRIEAETMDLEQMPLQLVRTAMAQAAQVRAQVQSSVTRVLINDSENARELWWAQARDLKLPLLTLCLMPESACGPSNGRASLMQLRKWQLQQLASIIKDVDEACDNEDCAALSNALEYRVLPWLDGLEASLDLWQLTILTAQQAACTDSLGTPEEV